MANDLRIFKQRLFNLSAGNKSLVHRRCLATQDIDLTRLDDVSARLGWRVLGQLVAGREAMLVPQADPRDPISNKLSGDLLKLERRATALAEERGVYDLFVAWPYVQGAFKDGTAVRAPLVLWPVRLVRQGNNHVLQPREARPQFNTSFLLGYRYYQQVSLPSSLAEEDFSDWDDDLLGWRNRLYQTIQETDWQLNFNTALFDEGLVPMPALLKADLTALSEAPGVLKLHSHAVLGLFPQADAWLGQDYELLQERNATLEGLLGELRQPTRPEQSVSEADLLTPLAVDGSQEEVLTRLLEGHSVVVQGPPGTGKSQLIANAAAAFMAQGKRVLVVCQKQAALQVVWQRLHDVGIAQHLALVHDVAEDRQQLFRQLAAQLDLLTEGKTPVAETAQHQQRYDQLCQRITQAQQPLEDFSRALNNTDPAGKNARWLYQNSRLQAPQFTLNQPVTDLPLHDIDYQQSTLLQALRLGWVTYGQDHAWQVRLPLHHRDRSFVSSFHQLSTQLGTWKELHQWAHHLAEAQDPATLYQHWQGVLQSVEPGDANLLWAICQAEEAGTLQPALTHLRGLLRRSNGKMLPLVEARQALALMERAGGYQGNAVSRMWWRLTAGHDHRQLEHWAEKLGQSLDAWHSLVAAITTSIEIQETWDKLAQNLGISTGYSLTDITQGIERIEALLPQARLLVFTPAIQALYKRPDAWAAFQQLTTQLRHFLQLDTDLHQVLHPAQLQRVLAEDGFVNRLSQALNLDFDSMAAFDRLLAGLSKPWAKLVIQTLEEGPRLITTTVSGGDASEALLDLLRNSLFCSWLHYLEQLHPILRATEGDWIAMLEAELQAATSLKQTYSQPLLRALLQDQVSDELAYNRVGNLKTYAGLRAQVVKKQRLWPLRRLVAEYGDELFRLVPCWLVSPETASALFPLEKVFDLVIFDEASQCFSEKGLPAMCRGKQVLVAGDSQQLRPFNLYTTRFFSEEDEEDEAENPGQLAESLLDLASLYLPQHWLTGHYRSELPELMAFSNRHFYQNKLLVLPKREALERNRPAINLVRTQGTWQQNTNLEEARKVVGLLRILEASTAIASVGIITFNYPQAALIEELLDRELPHRPASLFVKNIENVQGDERDIIIFSLGYAPDSAGRMVAQFGSLSQAGGENRLNVAITRARQSIWLVSSISHHQLNTEGSTHAGPRLLRQYLHYVQALAEGQPWSEALDAALHNTQATTATHGMATPVAQALAQVPLPEDWQWRAPLPFADGGLYHRGALQVAVYTDDALGMRWATRAWFVHLPSLLRHNGWPWRRAYSRQLWLGQSAHVLQSVTHQTHPSAR